MNGRRVRANAFLLSLFVLIISLGLGGCTKPKLIIEEPDNTAWMNINNTFILPPGQYYSDIKKEMWQGILIQIGEGQAPDGMLPPDIGVEITGDESKSYRLSEFRWINIQGNNPNKNDPMQWNDVSKLWPDPANISNKCNAVDICAGKNCLCPSPPCDTSAALGLIPPSCLRNRSLHAYLKTQAIITYWMGPAGYNSYLRMTDGIHPHQTFELLDKVKVTVVAHDGSTIKTFDDAKSIVIKENPVPNHHRMMDPPGDG